ncbi:OsmC family protein [Mariniluteicoccus flavus]
MTNAESQTPDSLRQITLTRTAQGRYTARNARGLELELGHGDDLFTPVELLLAAIGGCSSIDVDTVTSRRGEPDRFDVTVSGDKVSDETGSRMTHLRVAYDLEFPDTDAGREAASLVERAVKLSHDKLCTVSRTVQLGSEVEMVTEK